MPNCISEAIANGANKSAILPPIITPKFKSFLKNWIKIDARVEIVIQPKTLVFSINTGLKKYMNKSC